MPLCVEIASQFNKCKTKTEQELLSVVEIIVKCAAEHPSFEQRQKFADILADSGLRKAIKVCINSRIPPDYDINSNDNSIDWMLDVEIQ